MAAPDWLKSGYRDSQDRLRRVVMGTSEQHLRDYAQKLGKHIEQIYSVDRVAHMRSGNVVKAKTVTTFYGLLSA